MCTNYRLAIADKDALDVWFGELSMSDWLNPEPRGKEGSELYPGYTGAVIHRGSNVLARYRWGFQNFMDPKRLLVNAMAETVAEKRTFAKAFREARCLVPATGFYDYRKSDPPGQKGRYLFTTPDEYFAFAGLWQERDGVRSYTLLTCEPNKVVKEYHHRMPVILPKKAYATWLDPDATAAELQELLVPWMGKMTATAAPKPKVDTGEAAAMVVKGKTTKGKK
jgi:putative SOS response-associated peptidase YedK